MTVLVFDRPQTGGLHPKRDDPTSEDHLTNNKQLRFRLILASVTRVSLVSYCQVLRLLGLT